MPHVSPPIRLALAVVAVCALVLLGLDPHSSSDASAGAEARRSSAAASLPYEVEVTGADFAWHVRYPGLDGVLWTQDDTYGERDLHVPAGRPTRIHLRSRDYIYNLALPQFGLKEVAVPDLEFSLELRADEAGTFELRGDQMCGWSHPRLLGRLQVEAPRQ